MGIDLSGGFIKPTWWGPFSVSRSSIVPALNGTAQGLPEDIVSRAVEQTRLAIRSTAGITKGSTGPARSKSTTQMLDRMAPLKAKSAPSGSQVANYKPTALSAYDSELRVFIVAQALIARLDIEESADANGNLRLTCCDVLSKHPLAILTRPTPSMVTAEYKKVEDAAAFRDERRDNILAQDQVLPRYFLTERSFSGPSKQATMELMAVVADVLASVLHRMKHRFAIRRPESCGPIAPMISAPSHFSFPGGHAAYGFAEAEVLSNRLVGAARFDSRLHRLAYLVGENRVVAGLHYPMDTDAGMLLGYGIGTWLAALGVQTGPGPFPVFTGEYTVSGKKGAEVGVADASSRTAELRLCSEWQEIYLRALLEWEPAAGG